jgi:glycosyltransferase involved in cell wall biosynthesis
MLQQKITPLLLTFNEEANIGRVLERLRWAPRVVVLDSFSTDATLDIARSFPNADVHQRTFDSFAGQCNYGLGLVETEWVLSMDADYVLTPELIDEIAALPAEPGVDGFEVGFTYCIDGKPLRGTLYPPRVVLYRRDAATYQQDGHAHRVEIDGDVGRLGGRILHDDRKPLASWLRAQQKYAVQEADKLLATPPDDLGLADRLRLKGVVAPILAPLYALFVKGGVLDGIAGWQYALQRTYAEILLALHLFERQKRPLSSAPSEPEHSSTNQNSLRRSSTPHSNAR